MALSAQTDNIMPCRGEAWQWSPPPFCSFHIAETFSLRRPNTTHYLGLPDTYRHVSHDIISHIYGARPACLLTPHLALPTEVAPSAAVSVWQRRKVSAGGGVPVSQRLAVFPRALSISSACTPVSLTHW